MSENWLNALEVAVVALCAVATLRSWFVERARIAASLLPVHMEIHTKSEFFNNVVDAIGDACIHVLREALTGPLLNDLLKAVATGNPVNIEQVIENDGRPLVDLVIQQLGILAPIAEGLWGKTGLGDKIRSVLTGHVLPVAAENAQHVADLREVVTLSDGTSLLPPEVLPPVES
jgi:hypothetical protein